LSKCGDCGTDSCPDQFRVCRELASIDSECGTDTCRNAYDVVYGGLAAVLMTAVCLAIDGYLAIAFWRGEPGVHGVVFLSLVSCLLKWIAFGLIMRGDSVGMTVMVRDTHCFGSPGQSLLGSAVSLVIAGLILTVLSAFASMVQGPACALID
jgi:hypothetical protein